MQGDEERRGPRTSPGWGPHDRLVSELRSGNSEALRWVMDTYREPLVACARRNLDGNADPEDLVQEAFLRIWAHRERLRHDGSVPALLFVMVRNLSLKERRRQNRWVPLGLWAASAPASRTPLEDLLDRELQHLVDEAIHRLPPRREAVFRKVRKEGLSHREAADALGISPQTVANTMSSAMADLRISLSQLL